MDTPKVKSRISGRSLVVAAERQVSCDLAGEAVILKLDAGMYYGLDPIGARIWELIQEPMTVKDIRDVLLQEYEVAPEQCESELLALLENLVVEGLIDIQVDIQDALETKPLPALVTTKWWHRIR